jgi:hypothetical protein
MRLLEVVWTGSPGSEIYAIRPYLTEQAPVGE